MKQLLYILSLILFFTACSKEENLPEKVGEEVSFYPLQTRSAGDVSQFNNGDSIGIFAIKVGSTLKNTNVWDNIKYVYSSQRKCFIGANISNTIFRTGEELEYFLYFPYKSQIVSVNAIPIAMTGTRKDDILYSRVISDKKQIGLTFRHLMAKVSLKIDARNANAKNVHILSYTDGTFNLAAGTVQPVINRRTPLQLEKSGTTNYIGLIIPQSYNAKENIITVDNESYSFAKGRTLHAGMLNEISFMGKDIIYDFSATPNTISLSALPTASYPFSILSTKSEGINGVKLPNTTISVPYNIVSKPSWVSLTDNRVLAEENLLSARTGTVTFTQSGSNKTINISINQAAANVATSYIFTLADGNTTSVWSDILSTGENQTFSFISKKIETINGKSPKETTISYTGSCPQEWVKISGSTITVANNPSKSVRGAIVTFTQSGSNKIIKITIHQGKKNEIIIEKN